MVIGSMVRLTSEKAARWRYDSAATNNAPIMQADVAIEIPEEQQLAKNRSRKSASES